MKIAILTNFQEFNPGYSLTGIVKDQCTMLTRFGNEVHLYVNEQFHGDTFPGDYKLQKKVPFAHLKDYSSKDQLLADHKEIINKTSQIILTELTSFDAVFTHDWIFTGWNMPYALGIQQASLAIEKPAWLHWIHSVPSGKKDWWRINDYGKKHRIVFPNKSDARRVAEQYRGSEGQVVVIPHIKDLRTWFDFSQETIHFINDFPAVMQSQIVQILPASVDRLSAKRVKEVINLFSKLKKKGLSVCLVIANQWATQKAHKEAVDEYLIAASDKKLKPMEEVIFTSEWKSPTYDAGISKTMLRELFLCSNLFVFPTREESFGLVVPEASLSGCFMVLNKSLDQQVEITNNKSLYMHFGSFHNNFEPPKGWDAYLDDMASIIIHRMMCNEAIQTKTFVRQMYNLDNMYYSYYEPTIKGSVTW